MSGRIEGKRVVVGLSGGIACYKVRRAGAPAARRGGARARGDDALGLRVHHAADAADAGGRAGVDRSVRPDAGVGDRPHPSRRRRRRDPRRAGDRQPDRQSGGRPRRRPADHGAARHPRPGAAGAGDERAHVGESAGAGQPGAAAATRLAGDRSRRRRAGLRLRGRRPPGGAGADRRRSGARAEPAGSPGRARAGDRRPESRGDRSGALHLQPLDRPYGLRDGRRGVAARRGRRAGERADGAPRPARRALRARPDGGRDARRRTA